MQAHRFKPLGNLINQFGLAMQATVAQRSLRRAYVLGKPWKPEPEHFMSSFALE